MDELKDKIRNSSSTIVAEIKSEIGELEAEFIKAKKEQKLGILLIVASFILPQFAPAIANGLFTTLLVISLFFLLLYYGIKFTLGNTSTIRRYNASVNKIIFKKALSILNLNGEMVEDGEAKPSQIELLLKNGLFKPQKNYGSQNTILLLDDLDKSELITESHNTNQVDNILQINYKDSILKISELDIKHVTGSGKNRHTKQIFHGYFASFDLKKNLTGKTFVSAEADKHGFANLGFFNKADGAKETLLEWNEFEDLLHVATTNEVEARYILTPNFMSDLHDWWKGRETNIRLSFINNRLYVLYPDNKIRLNQTVDHLTDEAVTEYIFSITWPLQNVLKLIDDVRL